MIRIENNRIHIGDLLKRFLMLRDDEILENISPSRYIAEMQMSVEERLRILNDRSRTQRIGQQNKLYTIPDLVVFQNYKTLVRYATNISFIHQKQHPMRIKISPELSPCFTLNELPGTVFSKLAPGTPHKLTLSFFSEEKRDYLSFIRFEADDEVAILPIVALAPRPLLIFPDVIEISRTVVNIQSDKRVYIKNCGEAPVDFKFKADFPFSVCPRIGILDADGILDVKVSYKNCRVQRNTSDLILSYDGIQLCSKLTCEAKNCDIFLDKTVLYFEDTFLSLKRCLHVNLINNSEHTMKYQWKQYETKYAEMEKCEQYRHKLQDMNEFEVLRNIQDENPNITDAELHKMFIQRIYQDELAEFDSTDQFLFHDQNFKFQEESGVIGPHTTMTIEVFFSPFEADSYLRWAYFEVTGRETRQPLKMVGSGIGPVVTLHIKDLDVEDLYLCAKHQYEIVAKNAGIIPATLSYCHKSLDFGGSMTCTPPEISIEPGTCEKMVLEFSSTVQGKFLEIIKFKIEESQEHIDLIFRGNIICPLLTYDVEEINFGVVAFGFAVEKEISMNNSTEVPIEFKISILNDGVDEAITWVNFSMNHDENLVSSTPKEFNIHPDEATVAGNSSITIRITLIPNKVQDSSTFLHTYMWGSKKHYVEIPIFYKCVVPIIECIPPRLDIRYCFIDCPYDRMFTLKNISEVAGYLLYREQDQDMGLTCNLSLTESYIEPGETISIHLEIKGFELGLHTKNLNFTVFGQSPITMCKLSCDVQGPVICVNPEEIKFGSVQLLKWQSRTLRVMNDSPVSADISITVANSTFHVSPNEFVLEASEKMDVEISIYLTFCAKYSSTIILNIVNNSDPLRVPVTAVGIGSCVLFEPILEPQFDLGTLMTHNHFSVPFKMTNMGRETQRLCFSTMNNIKSMKLDPAALKGYPFSVEPNLFEISEKDSKTGNVEIYNSTPGPAELMYYCYSFDKGGKITKIFDVKLVAYFEDPVLSLSKNSLHFRMDVTPAGITQYLKETFVVTNDTYLALDIYISLDPPFFVHDSNGCLISILNTNVPSKENFSFFVEFVPPSSEKRCYSSAGMMIIGFKFHPRMFNVPLLGEVNYPTLITHPDSIENEQISPMANSSREFILKNVSPLTATFKFQWVIDTYNIEKLPSPRNGISLSRHSLWRLDPSPNQGGEISMFTEGPDGPGYALESVFLESSQNVSRRPSLNAMRKTILQHRRLPQINDQATRKMLRACNLILGSVIQGSQEETAYLKALKHIPDLDTNINESMLNITPFHGFLEPFECILVNFYIRPTPQTSLKAAVRCQIEGGAEETIEVSGVCGDIAFDIDKREINFGTQLFSDILQTTVTLTNTGYIAFDYTIMDDYDGVPTKQEVDYGWLSVTPNIGTLEPGKSVKLVVKYFPGTTGEFKEYFTVEIGYLRAVKVDVYGFGLYSQLSVLLPRPNLSNDSDSYFYYNAIASLASKGFEIHQNTKLLHEDPLDDTTKSILENDGWVVIEHMDEDVPSLVDIDMALERKLGYEFLQNRPYIFSHIKTLKKKHFTIPNFKVPPYKVSFGNVRLDVHYKQDITLCNYGPGTCSIRLIFVDKKLFESNGLMAVLDAQRVKLNEFTNLSITFQPNVKASKIQEAYFSQRLFIEVLQGAKIPIDITASIGVPVMELNTKCVDFYGVLVGNCKRKTIRIQNTGFVEVNWTCSIDSSLFFVKKTEGVLNSGDSEKLHIYFEPKNKGPRQAVITYLIEGNAEEYTATLNGYGLEPRIIIRDHLMEFTPSLQYSPAIEQTFTLQNISGFSNEIFFSDYDRNSPIHDRIVNIFWKFQNAKKIYISQLCFGPTPSDIYKFLFSEMLYEMIEKGGSYTELMKYSQTDIIESQELMEKTLDLMEHYTESLTTVRKSPQNTFIDAESKEEAPVEEKKSNVIMVFYGNKYTDYLQAATETSKMLEIPRYSLDGMIVDMLIQNNSPQTEEVNKIIEGAYFNRMQLDDCVCRVNVIEDKTEEIWRRIEIIQTMKPVTKRKKRKVLKRRLKVKNRQINRLVPRDHLKNRIRLTQLRRFKRYPKILLHRFFPKKLNKTNATKNVSCVYFIFFTCSFLEHNNLLKAEVQNAKDEEVKRREDLKKKLLDIHDYSNLAGEEYEVFQEILEERKKYSASKRMDLRARIQTGLNQYGFQSKANDLKTFWEYLDKYYRFGATTNVKLPSRMLKFTASQQQTFMMHTKSAKGSKSSWKSESSKGKRSRKKGKSKRSASPKNADSVYFSQFDVKFCEILHILEYWDKRTNELVKPIPNFASMMASGKKSSAKSSPRKTNKGRKKSLTSSTHNALAQDDNEVTINTSYNPHIGYPVWIIGQAHQKRDLKYWPIINQLNKMISMHCLKATQPISKEIDVIYTVLKKPSVRKNIETPEVFELIRSETTGNEEKRDSIICESDNASPSSSFSISMKKRTRKRRLTLVSTGSELEQIKAVNVRFNLDPGQTQEITVLFKPLYSGTFKCSYYFEVVGTNYRHKVDVLAYCDYPRIDTSPNTMFPHRVQNVDSKSMFLNGIYVISQQVLDFGTLLFIPYNLLEAKCTISMLNTSTMTCYVAITFRNGSDAFFCEEENVCIIIRPGRQYCLSLYAKPTNEGLFKETLLIIIKNNPTIQEINLSCYACPLKFEVSPKVINFNKVILGKTETEIVCFYNHTAVMVYFELECEVSSEFRVNSFNGYLEPCSIFELTISYTPDSIGDRKEFMTVKVFDREKQYPLPVYTEVLTVLAEVATFCLQYPTNIDIGLVKGKTPLFFPFTVTNSGKYDVKIILTKNQDPKKISDYFKMKHMEYVVKGESKYSNNCRFLCNKQLSFSNIPIMDVMILDNYRNSAVDCFTLMASGSVALSKFELCPYGEYFLGYQNVNTKRSSILTLKNTGKFSFSYTILTPKIIHEQTLRKKTKKEVLVQTGPEVSSIPSIVETDVATLKSPTKSNKSKTSGSTRRRKPKSKPKIENLEVVTGVFTIFPSKGTIKPNETVSITVNSAPTECKKYSETIIFFVSEPSPEDHKGRFLNLHVEGTEPSISFTDFDFMFPELYITKCIEDLPYVGENFVFETNKQRLNFGKIAVYHSVKTRFRIPNTGHVTATVHFDVKEKDSDFTVSSRVIDIPPYKSEFNTICFSPKTIGIRSGVLDIRCQGFSSGHILNQRMLLLGEACMPTIEILQPVVPKFGDMPEINLGSIFVDEMAREKVIIKNNGSVPCKVIVEICDDPEALLYITVHSESELAESEVKNIPVRCNSISLNAEEKAYIYLMVRSSKIVDLKAHLNISVVNNCFDNWKLPITAHCFYSAVSLIGLPTDYEDGVGIYYLLNFGFINKNELHKRYFKIKNFSEKTYRFEFRKMFGLTFHPTVGHLYALSEKNVVAGFTTNQNISLGNMQIGVTITEIQLVSGDSILPWDDRQDCSIFNANPSTPTINSQSEETDQGLEALYDSLSLEMEYGNMEPEYRILEDGFQISILVSARCSFSNYYCELREIVFPNVQLHSEAIKLIYVENRSNANLKVRWSLMNFHRHEATQAVSSNASSENSEIPQEISLSGVTRPSIGSTVTNFLNEAFNIQPKTVIILPDKEKEFKITFSPTRNEVHECFLKANMENLNPETSDLEIRLKGEILQFPYQIHSPYLEDYEQSDSRFKAFCGYVAENNTKLLNFLALGIGSKCIRSLYIMNDTNSPIGFTWKNVRTNVEKASFFIAKKKKAIFCLEK
ncbi:hypothetical protein WA026_000906 [Henosepilachna vigintioctopunctata]|uniref:HYDIN/VesB/CFA65-like Ig-like domain-containing protein n=1 Tax=Henosepilachna vigintioctopunctata TaxID=420089 RepID=A0AAW1V8X3_9CUCU